jgi:adenylosuccinate lyase
MAGARVPGPVEVRTEEHTTRHDVVAFLNCWRRGMDEVGHEWVHRGLTSSDVVDTANAMRMAKAAEHVRWSLDALSITLARHALAHRSTLRVGRTHGQTAELTTWGFRVAGLAFAVERASQRLGFLGPNWTVGKLSGPVGDNKHLTLADEENALQRLNLATATAPTQVVMRDGYADFVFCLSQAASVIGALAMEIRLSARSDTGEVAEGFADGQKGSSAMPHKRNPITAEKLSGLSRLVRAQVGPVQEGIELHHERDISHSSVERVALQTAAVLTEHMAREANAMMTNLVVNTDRMWTNVTRSPELASAFIRNKLVEQGMHPDTAWGLVADAFARLADGSSFTRATALAAAWDAMPVDRRLLHRGWKPAWAAILREYDDQQPGRGANFVYAELEAMLTAFDA